MTSIFQKGERIVTQQQNEKLLSKSEACQALGGIGSTLFYALLKKGDLAACKIGKRTMVKQSEINRYLSTLQPYQSAYAAKEPRNADITAFARVALP